MSTATYETPASVNADFGAVARVDSNSLPWLASPQAGVERRLLDRVGGEVARATSLVRYAADSQFPPHRHGAGEEFLVLEGTFCDEHGEYPAGTYVRNPPGSRHAPFTREGCVIFVKLRQMRPQGEPGVVLDSNALAWQPGIADGHSHRRLFENEHGERVALERLAPGAAVEQPVDGGAEILVLAGSLVDDRGEYGYRAWLRFPAGGSLQLQSPAGCEYWVKRGHLGT